jgi:nicotinic acid mononucleotide adenylyltransferase
MESYKNTLRVFVYVIHKNFVSIHLIYFLGKDDHTYAKTWTDNQTTFTQTKILCMDEKGVQVMTETGTMSAKGSIVTDCDSVVYWDNERGIFYFGWLN